MRTIEERLTEILEQAANLECFGATNVLDDVLRLIEKLLEDFRAEGIAGREIGEKGNE